MQKRIKDLNLSHAHIKEVTPGPHMKPVSALKTRKRRTDILRRMLNASGRLYVCEWCHCEDMTLDNGEWQWKDKPLTLQIDHIHGRDGTDNQDRLENLRYLCPNCHCQTANWGGKRTKIPKVS
jgi:5-methylcytosine-specific restriction endonuclease McrA